MSQSGMACSKCASKGIGVFKCQGCSNIYCRKHASEHRDDLGQQLEVILHEHDQVHQLIHQETPPDYPLMLGIDRWEQNSIRKIQQAAENIRKQVHQFIQTQQEATATALNNLSQRLRKAREDDDYVETDLKTWTKKLESLRQELTNSDSSLLLHEDAKRALVSDLYLALPQQQNRPSDCLLHSIGDILIEDNGQLAIHGQRKRGDAHLYGKNEYSQGKHQVRFIIDKRDSHCLSTFGIVSIGSQSSVFGWNSNDQTVGTRYLSAQQTPLQRDLKGETIFQIQLIIDCDQRKISYINERTRSVREIEVNANVCPLPWQLYFYLFDIQDRVRLLPLDKT